MSNELVHLISPKLILDICNVSEKAAIAATALIGRNNEKQADQLAVDAMRTALNQLSINGTIVIGEGERDKAPMLYIGEKVGLGGTEIDIALDPLEGTTLTAHSKPNALTVLAIASKGGFLNAPDLYMQKLAVGVNAPPGAIDLDYSISKNITALADILNKKIENICVCILERERHQNIIKDVLATGARVQLIADGDVAAIIATTMHDSPIDMYIGTGGAPEGVLAAAALVCAGKGFMQARLCFETQEQIKRAKQMGITDIHQKYTKSDLASGDIIFAATGVTDGMLVHGVRHHNDSIITQTLIMENMNNKIYRIQSEH